MNDESENKMEYNWIMSDSSIVIVKREIFQNDLRLDLDTNWIRFSNINKVTIGKSEKLDTLEIVGMVVGSLAMLGLLIILIADSFHLSAEDVRRAIGNAN